MSKVVIIGAGPAGLTAAYELLSRDPQSSVMILEESQEVGGISRTVRHHGNRMDIGGHRFFSKDARVRAWWEKMMPTQGADAIDDKILGRTKPLVEDGPDPEKEDRVMLIRQRISRIYYKKKFFDYPVSLKMQTIKNMGFVTTMEAGFSYMKSVIVKRPEDNLENFYVNRFGKKLYSMFFEGYTEKLWGRHPSEISADWGAQRVKGLSIIAVIKDMFSKLMPNRDTTKVETSLIEEFYYPKYGPGQLWETVAEQIVELGGVLQKGCSVKSLKTGEVDGTKKITGVVYEKDGNMVEETADIVISTMPIKDLIAGISEAPDNVSEVAQGLPYRDFVTVGMLVNKLNLKNETAIPTLGNIVPDCWIYVQDVGVKLGRIQIFNNWSPYMVADPENTVWIGLEYFCAEGDDFWNMSGKDTIKLAYKELRHMGVLEKGTKVLDAHRERVKKAYPAYFDTYDRMDEVIEYLNGYENLYCIGRNGQHRYNNMDHSMVTAFEAVDNILSGEKDKTNVWNVNTEKEYHEEEKKSE